MKFNFAKMLGSQHIGRIDPSLGITFTMKGIGIRDKANGGNINVYDSANNTISAIPEDFVLGDFPAYAFPTNDLAAGDLVIHNNSLKFVKSKNEDGTVSVVNYKTQEIQNLIPAKTMLGYFVASKVFSPFSGIVGGGGGGGGADGVFGGLKPEMLMMLAMMGDDGEDGLFGGGDDSLFPLMMMSGGLGNLFGGAPAADGAANPMGGMMQALILSKVLKG